MKKIKILIFSVFVLVLASIQSPAQEKREQLWLIGTEVIKPEMMNQYMEMNKELLAICKEVNFPFSYQFWTSGDFKYYLWYPINSMDDASKIEAAWGTVIEKYGAEKYKKFNDCIDYTEDKFATVRFDLSYEPASPRIKEDERLYCKWQAFYLKKGKEKEMEALVQKANAVSKAKNIGDATYIGYGRTGFESPVIILWRFGKSINDFLDQDSKNWELIKDDFKEINNAAMTCFRKEEKKDTWWLKNLSYSKNK
jgi:hypothetical protein